MLLPMILGLAVSAGVVGCAQKSQRLQEFSSSSAPIEPPHAESAQVAPALLQQNDAAVHASSPQQQQQKNSSSDSGDSVSSDEAAATATAAASARPASVGAAPVDPGAAALASAITQSLTKSSRGSAKLAAAAAGERDAVVVSLAELRNQSHVSCSEFNAFRERLAELLSQAGRKDNVRFISSESSEEARAHAAGDGADVDVDYQLHGAAYLVTRAGFDWWELYLSLTPADRAWNIWRSPSRIYVLRHPQPGQIQVLLSDELLQDD